MRVLTRWITVSSVFLLASCIPKGANPDDPYEAINRKTYKFNRAFDATFLKPLAKIYKWALPSVVRASINNAYENINMIPTVGNDLLQADFRYAIKDTWRFFFNSTFGIGGLFDVAASRFGLPPHSNDLGLTFAKWGNPKSPYIMIPLLGPSTIRDGMADMFQYAIMTPYPYIQYNYVLYPLLGVRYVDLRSQFLDTEKLMQEAFDQYAFMRDAYLQHRNYKIQMVLSKKNMTPEEQAAADQNLGTDYIGE